MTATTDAAVSVDPSGTLVELLAVAFGTSPIVERSPDGTLVAFAESWDADSVVMPTTRVRLLRAHDRSRPLGWLDEWQIDDVGLHARGRLVGGAGQLDDLRELVAAGLLADASIGFAPSVQADQWSPPQRRNGLARVVRRQARIREVSLVDQAAVSGSRVLQITAPRPGPSSSTVAAIADAEDAVRGSGYVARTRIDQQAEAALAIAEADELVAGRQRWVQLDQLDAEPAPAPTLAPAAGKSWQQQLDEENERMWRLAREDEARLEYFEALARRQRAEAYAERHASQLDAVLRAHR